MITVNVFLNSSVFVRSEIISASTSKYFFFPTVRFATIDVSAAPRAPARAATLPPPGAGEFDASSSKNFTTVFSVSIIFLLLIFR
jgi:hypothetical protein